MEEYEQKKRAQYEHDALKYARNSKFYNFEEAIFNGLSRERIMREPAARAFIAGLWHRHVANYAPLNSAVPELRVRIPRLSGFRWATARYSRHLILVDRQILKPRFLAHEVAHLLTPGDRNHGPEFASALLEVWREFGIGRAYARRRAAEFGVEVAERKARTLTADLHQALDQRGNAEIPVSADLHQRGSRASVTHPQLSADLHQAGSRAGVTTAGDLSGPRHIADPQHRDGGAL